MMQGGTNAKPSSMSTSYIVKKWASGVFGPITLSKTADRMAILGFSLSISSSFGTITSSNGIDISEINTAFGVVIKEPAGAWEGGQWTLIDTGDRTIRTSRMEYGTICRIEDGRLKFPRTYNSSGSTSPYNLNSMEGLLQGFIPVELVGGGRKLSLLRRLFRGRRS